MSSPDPPRSQPQTARHPTAQIGGWGEQLVCRWLEQKQWHILAQRWHCRWGELDIIARSPPSSPDSPAYLDRLAFVEVKTRQSQNWDADGRLAITRQKQQKLWKTARLFLGKYPHLSELSCQFDVALVQCNQTKKSKPVDAGQVDDLLRSTTIEIHKPIQLGAYQLLLLDYIESAFVL